MTAQVINGSLEVTETVRFITPDMIINDMDDGDETFWECIKFVDLIEPELDIIAAISDSCGSVKVELIISVGSQLYRSTGVYSSYGYDDWSKWHTVEAKTKQVIYYE